MTMRSIEEIKADVKTALTDDPVTTLTNEASLRLVLDAVDFLFDIRDSLRSSRPRDIT